MLEEEGRVTAVDGVYAFVAATPSSACEGCSQKGTCHVLGGSGEMIIKASNDVRAEVGDRVKVAISSKTFFKASAVIYLLPVAALIAGGVFGKSIAPHLSLNIQSETVSAVFGFTSLVISFIAVRLLSHKIGESEADKARIIKVLNV